MDKETAFQTLSIIQKRLKDRTELEDRAFKVALECIQKQIPLRPVAKKAWYRCPVCNRQLRYTDPTKRYYKIKPYDWCLNCGQRFDWSFETV